MIWWILLPAIAALAAVVLIRALRIRPDRAEYVPVPQPEREAAYAQKLSRMVQYETVSVRGAPDPEKFRGFHALLEELFPVVFAHCEKTDLDGSLILKWKGKSSDDPILLLSHMDVVEASGGDWKYPPSPGPLPRARSGAGAAATPRAA